MTLCMYCRTLGPFVVMLGKITYDVLRFLFLYFEFYIPYACAFWMIFGKLKIQPVKISIFLLSCIRVYAQMLPQMLTLMGGVLPFHSSSAF